MANDSLLDIYIYENEQLLEKLEADLLACEKEESFSAERIDDIFRIVHTIKGSSAMMNFDNMAELSHAIEDLFDFLRGHKTLKKDFHSICNIGFRALDFINAEMAKIQSNGLPDGDVSALIEETKVLLTNLTQKKGKAASTKTRKKVAVTKSSASKAKKTSDTKKPNKTKAVTTKEASDVVDDVDDKELPCFMATVSFQSGCKMENIRAMGIVKSVASLCQKTATSPGNLEDDHSANLIALNGFKLFMLTHAPREEILSVIKKAFFIDKIDLDLIPASEIDAIFGKNTPGDTKTKGAGNNSAQGPLTAIRQSFMSVSLNKLDLLMDIVGEIVIAETTVTKNPDIMALQIDSFDQASRRLSKLTNELQDIVMSIRMIPVSSTFRKMERIVRDIAEKVNKKAELTLIGEETELDKNILDNLSDPLMHIIRNAMDHGLETPEAREAAGKSPVGSITLEARNTGGDVLIIISDDGRGLDKEKLINKAIEKGLTKKSPSEISDNEAYGFIFAPGFSTKSEVSEYSGRGVGMDVVMKSIQDLGGAVNLSSELGKGLSIQIRIPPSLAILDGMQVRVGTETFILPVLSIRESFKPDAEDIFLDTEGNENILVRGECYSIVRLHKLFSIDTAVQELKDGILIIVESDDQRYCIFVDHLIGEQQTVLKPLPTYISRTLGRIKNVAGCTILGDGNVSLILDIH